MIDKLNWVIILIGLSLFGFRGILPSWGVDLFILAVIVTVGANILFYAFLEEKTLRIGELAIKKRLMTHNEVAEVLACQKTCSNKFGEIAIQRDLLSRRQVKRLLAVHAGGVV